MSLPLPGDLKRQGTDYVNNIVWQTQGASPGSYTLTLTWLYATAPFQTVGPEHPVSIRLTLTN